MVCLHFGDSHLYLGTLVGLGLVEKRVPLLTNQAKTRKGIYRISDPLFAFWYRYIFSARGEIELGAGQASVCSYYAGQRCLVFRLSSVWHYLFSRDAFDASTRRIALDDSSVVPVGLNDLFE